MKIEKRSLKQAVDKGPQFKVVNGKLLAIDGTEPDMNIWPDGTTFVLVTHSGLERLNEMAFIINHWGA